MRLHLPISFPALSIPSSSPTSSIAAATAFTAVSIAIAPFSTGGIVLSLLPSISASGSAPLLPPFNASDSRRVALCAQRAQQKQRQNQNAGQEAASSWSLWAKLGMAQSMDEGDSSSRRGIANGADGGGGGGTTANGGAEQFLSGLPVRQVRYEHAHRRGALFCRTGNWLEFMDERRGGGEVRVRGTRQQTGRFSIFEFLAVAFGLVSIRAVASQHFLCMDSHGQLYAAPESRYSAECVFLEEMHPQVYNLYSSCAHGRPKRAWFVAISKTGRTRRGKYTRKGQKSAHFVLVDSGDGEEGAHPDEEQRANEGVIQQQGSVLDSLGHANSRADWLAHWSNFYEVHHHHHQHDHQQQRKMGREQKKLTGTPTTTTTTTTTIAAANTDGGGGGGRASGARSRLRWELPPPDDSGTIMEKKRKRRTGIG